MPSRSPALRSAVFALAMAGLAAGCSNNPETRGHLPEEHRLAQLQPGVMRQQDVRNLLGTPSSVDTFDGTTWYYISSRSQRYAFLEPEVLERRVIALTFDTAGVLKQVRDLGSGHGNRVVMDPDVTPTAGRELGLLEQLLGNLGRFGGPNQDAAGR